MPGSAVALWQGPAQPLRPADRRIALLLDTLWERHFADIPRVNDLVVGYDYPWKRHLGRIRMTLDQRTSQIGLNRLLDHDAVPSGVLVAILTHEIVHYAQGFGSPLPRTHRHAHAHGTVSHELAHRGLARYEDELACWIESAWPSFERRARADRQAAARADRLVPCALASRVVYSL